VTNEPAVDGSDGYSQDVIIAIIYGAADEFDQPRQDMLRICRSKSVLDPNAVNSSSHASGLFQFLPSTWGSTPYTDEDILAPIANAEVAAWMWANGRSGEWTCQ
jgi:soluble lytic murein transglycosylase-like protein